jgi:uncharacterized membrane protein (DUF485 family)
MNDHVSRLTHSAHYSQLIAARNRLIWPLLLIVFAAYFAFILTIAFAPGVLGQPVGDGVISVGMVTGFVLILFIFAITLYYVRTANRTIEPLIAELHKQAKGE